MNSNQTTVAQGASGATDSGYTNAFAQESAGPAALAQGIIYETMRMYLDVLQMDVEQKNKNLEAQGKMVQAQANSIIEAGNNQAMGLYFQGALTIGGALASGAAGKLVGRSEYNAADEESTTARNELKPLNKINDLQTEAKTSTPAAGTGSIDEDSVIRMKGGSFGKTEAEQQKDAEVMRALRKNRQEDYIAVKKQLDKEIEKRNEARTAAESRMSNISQNRNNYSTMIQSFTQAAGNIPQGIYTVKKAQNDAAAQLFQTAGALASASTQSMDSQIAKMYDTAFASLQALDKLRAAGQVN